MGEEREGQILDPGYGIVDLGSAGSLAPLN
jgi:hypothetical protein